MNKTFTAVIHRENDIFVADCPEVGSVSQGYTFDEALHNLQEATKIYVEEKDFIQRGRSIITTFELAVNV